MSSVLLLHGKKSVLLAMGHASRSETKRKPTFL